MTIRADGEQPHRSTSNGPQHLLAGRALGGAVINQEGAVNSAGRLASAIADAGHKAWPATSALEIRQVGIEQQIRTCRVLQATRGEIALAYRARDRHAAGQDARDFMAVVHD